MIESAEELDAIKGKIFQVEDGRYYIVDVNPIYKCSQCGEFAREPYTHNAQMYEGNNYHLPCIRKMHINSPKEKLSDNQRLDRVLARKSRNRIVSPKEIDELCSNLARKLRCTQKKLLPHDYMVGYYKGKPIVKWLSPTEEDIDDYKEKKFLLHDFWDEADRKKFKPAELELAVLLTLLGDKHGITHATSKRAGIVRRSKATHPRNHPEHP